MDAAVRRVAAPAGRAVAAYIMALLVACSGDAPPSGFEAVAPAGSPAGANVCPDLTGTFDLAGTALGNTIAGRQPPQTHGLPVVLTFKPGPSNIEGWWVVPRERLVAFAKEQSEDAPKRYARWRELVLKEHLPEAMRQNVEAYQSAVAEVGPPGPTYALIVGRRCADRWMLVYAEKEPGTGRGDPPRDVEREVWLARDAAGALLVKNITYTLKYYSIWAPSTQSIRTSSRTTWQRVEQADPESAAPLVAADLPPDPQTVPRERMVCTDVPQRVNAFSQRLTALLPPKSTVTRFTLNPVRQQDTDGRCPFAVVDVEIAGANAYFLARTVDWVRAEPDVDSVEVLRLDAGQRSDTMRRFRVVLR